MVPRVSAGTPGLAQVHSMPAAQWAHSGMSPPLDARVRTLGRLSNKNPFDINGITAHPGCAASAHHTICGAP